MESNFDPTCTDRCPLTLCFDKVREKHTSWFEFRKPAIQDDVTNGGKVLCGWHLQSKTFFEVIGNLSDTVLCSACSRGA